MFTFLTASNMSLFVNKMLYFYHGSYPDKFSVYIYSYAFQADKKAFMKKFYKPDFKYQDFAPQFKAEFWKPNKWADLFKDAGAR